MLKNLILSLPIRPVRNLKMLMQSVAPIHPRSCSICDYHGDFTYFGAPPRRDAMCKACGSLERHRLFWLWFKQNPDRIKGPFLHFAPERIFAERFRKSVPGYQTADLFQNADLAINIEAMELPDDSFQTLMCNHVLEHVDDHKAMRELHRILKPGGVAILSVPLVEGWEKTYEVGGIDTDNLRDVHFGQSDHIRYYGRDFRDRLKAAGFTISEEFTVEGPNVVTYGLLRGEKVFICTK